MKIEQLLALHFYNAREITLQGMGTFTLSPHFVMPKESDKDVEIPANTISFQYSLRATEDDALIDFIVQQTRKMKSLAAADLDSYLMLGKQFLNIGKPFLIEGLGTLVKNQQGEYEFTQGNSFLAKSENAPAALKEKREEPDISFASESKPKPINKKGLLITATILIVGMLALAAWYFLVKNNNPQPESEAATTLITDTALTVSVKPDSASVIKTEAPAPLNDGYNFKIVFMVTADSAAAVTRMNMMTARGHKIIMYKKDSPNYKLAEPFTLPLADTARIKDSLNSYYYAGKAFVELK